MGFRSSQKVKIPSPGKWKAFIHPLSISRARWIHSTPHLRSILILSHSHNHYPHIARSSPKLACNTLTRIYASSYGVSNFWVCKFSSFKWPLKEVEKHVLTVLNSVPYWSHYFYFCCEPVFRSVMLYFQVASQLWFSDEQLETESVPLTHKCVVHPLA